MHLCCHTTLNSRIICHFVQMCCHTTLNSRIICHFVQICCHTTLNSRIFCHFVQLCCYTTSKSWRINRKHGNNFFKLRTIVKFVFFIKINKIFTRIMFLNCPKYEYKQGVPKNMRLRRRLGNFKI